VDQADRDTGIAFGDAVLLRSHPRILGWFESPAARG
jgi:hypothetical protein